MNAPAFSTIVVGYTPSSHARAAVTRAAALAAGGARLVVVNGAVGDRYTDSSFASTEDLAEVRRELDTAGVDYEIRQPVRGHDGAEEVLAAADELGAQLIVIGLRPRTAVGKFLLGSVAQTILMRAHCDVLAVKA